MYRDAWIRHPDFGHEHLRPHLCYHKRVRYYMAEAYDYGRNNTSEYRTDGHDGRVGWFSIQEARATITSSEDQEVLRKMLSARESVLRTFRAAHQAPRGGPHRTTA
eukprot:3526047-Alexandrium_andersonii.AAC.1